MSTPAGKPEDLKANLPAHLNDQSQMERDGKLVFAGPMSNQTDEQIQGMGPIVYRAGTFGEAHAMAEPDPKHAAGARTFTGANG